ncbi:MAG: cobalt-precorrin-6A reductase [Acuticoccus sp.]
MSGLASKILLLGGTSEAQELAAALKREGLSFVVSLAGRARADYPGPTRVGGFGGVEGLAAVLRDGEFTHIVDATHPFAAEISPGAARAAAATGARYLRLERPPWRAGPHDRFVDVASAGEAAAALPAGACAFLTLGARNLAPFLARRDLRLVVRAITRPDLGGRDDIAVIEARGPFALDPERALWNAHDFDALVTKNAGGTASEAKLVVARERGIPVVMIARPAGQPPADAGTADALMARLLASR